MIHGDAILQRIENTPTVHESPVVPIVIEECGEFTMQDEPSPHLLRYYKKYKERLSKFQEQIPEDGEDYYKVPIYPSDVLDSRDVVSVLSMTKYQQGLYSI